MASRPSSTPIAETKLDVPVRRARLVPRDALVALLAGAPTSRLTLVSAPAGSGKTTLLAQWLRSPAEARRFAWLSLDEDDNDPVRFWTAIVASLRRLEPGTGAQAAGALMASGTSLTGVVVPLLLNDVAAWGEPAVLVLDDLHVLYDDGLLGSLAYFVDRLPAMLHVAIATRSDPPLPLGRLRARGELIEVRAADLRFSDDEAAAFLGTLGVDIGAEELAALQDRTEGWAAGIQLAGLSLRGGAGLRLTGDHAHIVGYLGPEVLDVVPGGLRRFMLHTSVLDRMCPSLCDDVTGEHSAAERLEELERRNLFTVPLDVEGEWFRYHHLFAELLRHELDRGEPGLAPELHRRASAWFARQDEPIDAIRHAFAAQDMGAARELIAANWAEVFNRGWLATVSGWLEALGPDAARDDQRLWLASAWLALDRGRLDVLDALLDEHADPGRRAWSDVLRALHLFKVGDVAAARTAAARAVAARDAGGTFRRTVAHHVTGVTAYWQADRASAAEALAVAAALADGDGNRLGAQYARGYLALIELERGDSAAARDLLEEADAAIALEPQLDEHFTAALVHIARAAVTDSSATAAGHTARAVDLARRGAGATELAATLALHARVLGARGDPEAADPLQEARTIAHRCRGAARLSDELDEAARAVEGRRTPRRGPVAEGDLLSERELGILRLLRSELTLRDIGREVYLSHNTVKTHVRRVYAKLGVENREEAVARARELGLL